MAKKLTKTRLLNEIEEKVQALNLLKSALQSDRSRKAGAMEEYQQKFDQILNEKKK